jgi:tRNA 2-selenouridine synthase
MSIKRVPVNEFIELIDQFPVLDVRSPGEYKHAHIPGATSLPLFSDDERKEVGTTYKQESREAAIKIGLDFFGPKMREMVEFAEEISKHQEGNEKKMLLVHCWRGGMRSGAVAWLLDLYGFNIILLDGGYKAFRNWVLDMFRKDFPFRLIGGYTGSGKTIVLHELEKRGKKTLDLEGIARHKGSAFGGLDKLSQPTSEMFENEVAMKLYSLDKNYSGEEIWVEDESQRIGDLNMPIELWSEFRKKPLLFLEVPFEKRLAYLVKEYGRYEKEPLLNAITRIQKRLGGLETKTAVSCLMDNDLKGCFEILLKYYDKHYSKALHNRPNLEEVIRKIKCDDVDEKINSEKIIAFQYERSPAAN